MAESFETIRVRNNSLLSALEDNLNTVRNNKKEITDQLYGPNSSVAAVLEEGQSEDQTAFDLDEDAFLNHVQ